MNNKMYKTWYLLHSIIGGAQRAPLVKCLLADYPNDFALGGGLIQAATERNGKLPFSLTTGPLILTTKNWCLFILVCYISKQSILC